MNFNSPSSTRTIMDVLSFLDSQRGVIAPGQLSQSQIQGLIEHLPKLSGDDLDQLGQKESLCSICFTPFPALLAEEEMAIVMESPANPTEELGVTKLGQSWQCGHLFCRKDISKWIQSGHDSCPMCRRPLIEGGTSRSPIAESETLELETLLANLANGNVRENLTPNGFIVESRSSSDDRSNFSGMYS